MEGRVLVAGLGEAFSRSLRGTIKSSLGYTVRVAGRTAIRYRDQLGAVDLDCEVLSGPDLAVVVLERNWPVVWGGLNRDELLRRVSSALAFEGWTVLSPDETGYA